MATSDSELESVSGTVTALTPASVAPLAFALALDGPLMALDGPLMALDGPLFAGPESGTGFGAWFPLPVFTQTPPRD